MKPATIVCPLCRDTYRLRAEDCPTSGKFRAVGRVRLKANLTLEIEWCEYAGKYGNQAVGLVKLPDDLAAGDVLMSQARDDKDSVRRCYGTVLDVRRDPSTCILSVAWGPVEVYDKRAARARRAERMQARDTAEDSGESSADEETEVLF